MSTVQIPNGNREATIQGEQEPAATSPTFAVALALGLCVLASLLLAVPVLLPGILADNDFVAHYSYTFLLAHRQIPGGEGLFGWTTAFNAGCPFMLFNVPPLTYVLAYALSLFGRIDVLLGLKALLVASFAAVPLLTYWATRPILLGYGERVLAAVLATLASCELAGVYFYFANGMVNAAVGFTMALIVLGFGARVAQNPELRLRNIVGCAISGGACLLTHVQSYYMALLFSAALVVVGAVERRQLAFLGKRGVALGMAAFFSIALVSFWLLPSLPVAQSTEWVQVWTRSSVRVFLDLVSGQLLGGTSAYFMPRLAHKGHLAGIVLLVSAIVGVVVCVRRRSGRGIIVNAALFLWLLLGPRWAGPLRLLPLYPKLLYFRFLTMLAFSVVLLGAIGLRYLARRRLGMILVCLVVLVLGWNAFQISGRIFTDEAFPESRRDLDTVATWLKDHGDRRGRVFSEFLVGHIDEPSVNYLRHLLPIRSGFEEAVGWVYENSPSSTWLLKHGLYWHSAEAMLDANAAFNVKYLVLASSKLREYAAEDARWRLVLATPHYALFESVAYQPDLLNGVPHETLGWQQPTQHEYVIRFHTQALSAGSVLGIKVNSSPYWLANLDDRPVDVRRGPLGLMELQILDLPPGDHTLSLRWSHERQSREGLVITLLGGLGLMALNLAWLRRRVAARLAGGGTETRLGWVVVGGSVVLLAFGVPQLWRDFECPIAGGLESTRRLDTIYLGTYDDDRPERLHHLLLGRWEPRALHEGQAGRFLPAGRGSAPDVVVSVGDPAQVLVAVSYAMVSQGESLRVGAALLGNSVTTWFPCASEHPVRLSLSGPPGAAGRPLLVGLWFDSATRAFVRSIQVDGGIVGIEGEAFVAPPNASADFGYSGTEALYGHNDLWALAVLHFPMKRIRMEKPLVVLPARRYVAWIGVLDYSIPRDVAVSGFYAGRPMGLPRPIEPRPTGLSWFPLGELRATGQAETVAIEIAPAKDQYFFQKNTWIEFDTLIFVPAADESP